IRVELEASATRVAAVKMTEEQFVELKEIERQLDIAARSEDSVLSFEADTRLHNLIMVAAGNTRAHGIIRSLNGQIMRIRFLTGHRSGRIARSAMEQKEVIRALLARDAENAEKAMRAHLLNAKAQLRPLSNMENKFEEMLRNRKGD
ncbi:MAG: FCD domain-containing protein, partial [Nitrososphaerota archaeon]|nr:FCD domain-containing protein [Nitrososphaerota archaeon]